MFVVTRTVAHYAQLSYRDYFDSHRCVQRVDISGGTMVTTLMTGKMWPMPSVAQWSVLPMITHTTYRPLPYLLAPCSARQAHSTRDHGREKLLPLEVKSRNCPERSSLGKFCNEWNSWRFIKWTMNNWCHPLVGAKVRTCSNVWSAHLSLPNNNNYTLRCVEYGIRSSQSLFPYHQWPAI